jgi:hypothetical protein
MEDPADPALSYEKKVLLPRYKAILQIDPIDERDLEMIRTITREFFSALPAIRALCERALLENLQDEYDAQFLLGGVAAADGLYDLASILNSGTSGDGQFCCQFCDWRYEYALLNDRIAIYADEDGSHKEDRLLVDFKAGTPSRADGFLVAIAADARVTDGRTAALLALANRAASPKPALLLRNFLGRFKCCKCGAEGSAKAV